MRHRIHFRRFNRTMEHRKAMRRNMAQNLFEHGQIRTTLTKAKDLRPFVERIITMAVRRMLPKNALGRKMLKKLKVYAGNDHPHAAQTPEPLTI